MLQLPPSDSETNRVDMVRSFGLLNEPRSLQHDEIAAFARNLAATEWGLVSLVDSERLWFSGASNFVEIGGCRWSSFCTHVIAQPDAPLWVEDAREDFRFAHLPSVLNAPSLRFYAGAPILVNGFAVGSMCVFGSEPRPFDPHLVSQLCSLAKIVAEDLAARHRAQSTRMALAASADALIDCDDAGQIVSWSEGAERLFGFSSAEAVGCKIDIIVPPEHKAAHNRGIERWSRSGGARMGRRIDLCAQRKDGSSVDIELWMSAVHERGVPHIHANIRDISQRRVQALALEAAKVEAQAANEAKSTFLTNMSHELRTPLNGVVGVVDLLAGTPLSDHQRELTAIIKSSSDQLGRLIGDILDLARIESGGMLIAESDMVLSEILESVRNVSELAAQEKGLSIVVDQAADTTAMVIGDPLRLKQVLSNLVSNAVKFTQAGSVTVSVQRKSDTYRFAVSDTGIGFDDSQREVIFGRFQQADGTITRRFGGSGLGLAISRELVTAMGGEIDSYSASGEGATFWFTLPLSEARGASSPEIDQNEALPNMARVLIVDDNATNRRVAELLLQAIGTNAMSVEDGSQAVEAFTAGRFDAILMDMMMPVMDGLTATIAIRDIERREHLPHTPIIMLTANNLPQHIEASLNAGADLHLAKPLSAAALFEALSKVTETEAATDQNDHQAG